MNDNNKVGLTEFDDNRRKDLMKEILERGGIPTTIGTSISFTSIEPLEKLVEMVVRECASIVDNVEPGYNDYRSQIEVMMRNDCVKVLLDKFDIEDNRSETRKITGDGE